MKSFMMKTLNNHQILNRNSVRLSRRISGINAFLNRCSVSVIGIIRLLVILVLVLVLVLV